MTKNWSRFDRWERLLKSCRDHLARMNIQSDQLAIQQQVIRGPVASKFYNTSRLLINRIEKELKKRG